MKNIFGFSGTLRHFLSKNEWIDYYKKKLIRGKDRKGNRETKQSSVSYIQVRTANSPSFLFKVSSLFGLEVVKSIQDLK